MVSFAKPKSVSLRTEVLSIDVYSRFSGWRGDAEDKTSETNELSVGSTGEETSPSLYLDVSVGDVDAVEVVDGRADVPHDLRGLWGGGEKTQSQTGNRQRESGKERRLLPFPASHDAFRVRPSLTFLSEGLVTLCLDASEQLSSLHAATHTIAPT